ncbi:MAG: hypothetical protein HQM08_12145 [Candidatus Riflebacteria bacterium]|nr:hypothetical protein [Candidatus Riflebacteria bacterium]
MRIRLFFVIMLIALTSQAFAQDLSEVVASGTPLITMKTVNNHLRLMEYALGTRLTTAQKEIFLNSVKTECSQMEPDEKKAFMEADILVASMTTMSRDQLEVVRNVLKSDFEENVGQGPSDPAAQLFTSVVNSVSKVVASTASESLSLQALEAFAEYIGYCRNLAGGDKKLSQAERDSLQKYVTASYEKWPLERRVSLSDFDGKWHMIKTALKFGKKEKIDAWTSKLSEIFKGTVNLEFSDTSIDKMILGSLWTEMTDVAIELGENALGWTATPTGLIW